MAKAFIGTSGWNYPGWKDDFFAGVPRRAWLEHCARHFTGLEANGTFYRTLSPETCRRWREQTPDGFRFAVKGHRIVTHSRRLRDVGDSLRIQRDSLAPLGDRLAVVLWQTPATLAKDIAVLDDFLAALAQRWTTVRHAVEFRHRSWFDDETAQRLADANVAGTISDSSKWPLWDVVTTDIAYIRLHGHTRAYASSYAPRSLRAWAKRVRGWLHEGREVHVYFDNDSEGAAPHDALRLIDYAGVDRQAEIAAD